jgi:zinc transporter ZupT
MFVFVTSIVAMSEATFRKFMDAMLGFAAGVMLAASYWSLLAPAIEKAAEDPMYGDQLSWVPALIGFFLGCLMMKAADIVLTAMDVGGAPDVCADAGASKIKKNDDEKEASAPKTGGGGSSWKRTMLLVLAITVHNFPEGLAVGVGFGAQTEGSKKDFLQARNLAIGIGECFCGSGQTPVSVHL